MLKHRFFHKADGAGGATRHFTAQGLVDRYDAEKFAKRLFYAREKVEKNPGNAVKIARSYMQVIKHGVGCSNACAENTRIAFALIEPEVKKLVAAEKHDEALRAIIDTFLNFESNTYNDAHLLGKPKTTAFYNSFFLPREVADRIVDLVSGILQKSDADFNTLNEIAWMLRHRRGWEFSEKPIKYIDIDDGKLKTLDTWKLCYGRVTSHPGFYGSKEPHQYDESKHLRLL